MHPGARELAAKRGAARHGATLSLVGPGSPPGCFLPVAPGGDSGAAIGRREGQGNRTPRLQGERRDADTAGS